MHATRQKPQLLKDLVKSQRVSLDLTQRDVARAMGMSSVDYIGMVESGIRRLDFERLPAIAQVLHLDLDQITEMTFRELYGKPDTQWLVDLMYGYDRSLAKKIAQLTTAFQSDVRDVVDLLLAKQAAPVMQKAG
jgi:transcriptional regulator with XRE-family HTH domain